MWYQITLPRLELSLLYENLIPEYMRITLAHYYKDSENRIFAKTTEGWYLYV